MGSGEEGRGREEEGERRMGNEEKGCRRREKGREERRENREGKREEEEGEQLLQVDTVCQILVTAPGMQQQTKQEPWYHGDHRSHG